MTISQAKAVLKKYYPNESISSYQLLMLHRQFFKKDKIPKSFLEIRQAVKVLNANHNKLTKKDTIPMKLKKIKQRKTINKNPIKTEKYYQIQGYYCNRWEDVSAYDNKKEALVDIKKYRENERTSFRLIVRREKITTINKNPLPPGLVKAGQFGGKILARRAGAAGLAFGAGPIAGAATTTAGVILTGRDLYQYLKTLRKTKKVKPVKRKKRS